jgi:copper(I)-binding protein
VSRPESRTARTRPTRVAAIVGAMIGAVALAGCGAGQISQTADQVAAVNGANATAGSIAVRNALVEFDTAATGAAIYPVGGSAPLQMSIVNTGAQPDRLLSASSPVASSVEIVGDAAVPGGQTLVVEGAPAQPAAAPTAAATGTAAPTPTQAPAGPSPTAAASPTATAPTTEADGTPTASVVLTGLRQDLQVGPTYPVVLTFERAGSVQVSVPVGNPDIARQDAH